MSYVDEVFRTYLRYSEKDITETIPFFTSNTSAADTYREHSMTSGNQITQFTIKGTLRLINVANYLNTFNNILKPEILNIIAETGDRIQSVEENADAERNFYATLIEYAKNNGHLRNVDGFYTPQALMHDEMVLTNKDIIRALNTFEPTTTSPWGSPVKNRPRKLYPNRDITVEKKFINSIKRPPPSVRRKKKRRIELLRLRL